MCIAAFLMIWNVSFNSLPLMPHYRLRKKARYQELLDSEEQLKSYQEVDILRNEQRTCIRKFLAMREVMLNGVGGESSSTTIAVPSELPQMVEDAGTFSFEFHGHKPLATNVSSVSLQHASDHHQSMLLRMQRWDRDIHKRFISANENYTCTSSASTFHYKIVGGPNGVAISENGLGFAHVELELKPDKDAADESASKLVLTGILTVQFAPSSSRLSSAVWTTTQYVPSFSVDFSRSNAAAGVEAAEAAAPPRDDPSSSSNDSTLENQMNHPSVVSLEIKVSPTDTAESQSPGPGMSI
jgi:ribosomal protein S10